MIKLLDNTKSLSTLESDNTNGLGQLLTTNAIVTEELNGMYELEFDFLVSEKHYEDLVVGGIVKATVNEQKDEQMFRIYFVSKPMNGVVSVKAQHITYDLAKVPVQPFSATGSIPVKNAMLNNILGSYPFNMTTDIENTSSTYTLDIPRSFRECLGGYEGSILDTFRCEYEWDNLTVKMLAHRGSDKGVRIAYGKNLTDFKQEENIESVYTSVLGYAVVDETTYVGTVYDKIVSTYPKVLIVDFSNDYQEGSTPTSAELTQKAQDYATRNSIEVPTVNLTISFVPLYQTEEYKNIAPLERVSLGDTVHVFFEKMNVEANARVIKTVWNVNLNRYDSVELGSVKANLSTVIKNEVEEATKDIALNVEIDTGFIENQLDDMSSLIINGLGLFKTTTQLASGGVRIYLHNKPNLADSDTQYYISANGLLVSTDYGQTWNAAFDAQGNAVMNALSTITLRALEIYGSYIQGSTIVFGDPSDPNGKYISAAPYSLNNVISGVSFDGTGYIRMQPQEMFDVSNLAANGTNVYNRMIMQKNSNGYSNIYLYNYDEKNNFALANRLTMETGYSNICDGSKANRIQFANRNTYDRAFYANYFVMLADKCDTEISLSNREPISSRGNGWGANDIYLEADEDSNRLFLRNKQTIVISGTTTEYLGTEANYIGLLHDYTRNTNTLSIDNYEVNAIDTYFVYRANSIELKSTSTMGQTKITNYDMGSGETALGNQIDMRSTDDLHSFDIVNYDVDSSRAANYILMYKTTQENTITIGVDRGGTQIGRMELWRMNDTNIRVTLGIPNKTVSGKTYPRCEIIFNSSDGSVALYGTHLYWNGSQKW